MRRRSKAILNRRWRYSFRHRAIWQRFGKFGIGGRAFSPADRGWRTFDRHASRHHPLFYVHPRGRAPVIQAGAMARGGEVFVLDMGEPIKIARSPAQSMIGSWALRCATRQRAESADAGRRRLAGSAHALLLVELQRRRRLGRPPASTRCGSAACRANIRNLMVPKEAQTFIGQLIHEARHRLAARARRAVRERRGRRAATNCWRGALPKRSRS